MYLHRSNRMERLVDALAQVVAAPLSDPMRAEHIAVSSPGMEKWLSMELSKRLGVWANPAFPFPRKLLASSMAALLGEPPQGATAYEPETMLFALCRLLPRMLAQPEFGEVLHYLEGDTYARRRMALARRMADLFDQYATYRPDQVLQWASGKQQHFQAKLFAALQQEHGPLHVAARAQACLEMLSRLESKAVRERLLRVLPERISVFGVSTLPPLYVKLLAALGEHIDVHLFLLSPSREYYGDVRSQREIDAALRKQGDVPEVDIEAAELGVGHPLLASLGRHGRELQGVLEDEGRYQEASGDLYEDPGEDTLLHLLQADLLSLRDRGAEPRSALPELSPTDTSISVHACHGAMREVEVLHDQLLEMFAQSGLEPHDVIVMTPDIEAYAPMIDAVFSEASGRPRIAFRIADRGALRTHDVVSALDAVLDAVPSRMTGSCVLDLLGMPVVRARFGLGADDVEQARELLAKSGVRWGVDEQHRADVGQPALAENTWRFGLQRLALGYAMPLEDDALFCGRSPAEVDAGEADLLGRVFELCHTLFSLRDKLMTPCSVAEWVVRMREVLSALIVNDASTAADHKLCLRALAAIAQRASECGFDEPVELAAVRAELSAALDKSAPAPGFLAGGVTFCELVPMRSIPFKAVCLVGLSDGAFPRSDTPLGFDLMAERRRPGDRSRLHDDRQLFLEALLSARERLLITYVGRSIHDGKARPPSVLISELFDHIARSCRLPSEAAPDVAARAALFEQRLTTAHPLQAFSPRNFGADDDVRLFSYAHGHCAAAHALLQPIGRRTAFLDGLNPQPVAAPTLLLLSDLETWLAHPVKWFIQRRLGLPLGGDRVELMDREPMELDSLQRWKVGSDLLAGVQRNQDAAAMAAYAHATGQLPLGTPGKLEYRMRADEARALASAFGTHAQGPRLPRIDVDVDVGGVKLVGGLSEVWQTGQVRAQYSRVGTRHELRFFLRHVVLCALARRDEGASLPTRSVLVGRAEDGGPAAVAFEPLAEPLALLEALVHLFVLGQGAPVPLFEHASRVYAKVLHDTGDEAQGLSRARAAFEASGQANYGKDRHDAYVELVYRSFDEVLSRPEPIDFARTALLAYAPLLAHRSRA